VESHLSGVGAGERQAGVVRFLEKTLNSINMLSESLNTTSISAVADRQRDASCL